MKVAAYQAPLLDSGCLDALNLIRSQVERCEAEGVEILCCPEAILGGLADYAECAEEFAITVDGLDAMLTPLESKTVTTVIGFTESAHGSLYNSAAVFHRGRVTGLYRKLHPAIRRSAYTPGCDVPVFRAGGLTFGIVICNDSNFPEPAQRITAQGATALFIPTNNGLPPKRAHAELIAEARTADIAIAVENNIWVIRADVAGSTDKLVSYGSSGIVDPAGAVVRSARQFAEDLLIAEID